MSDDLFSNVYNPHVLSCLANLSNDEVFTSPDIVNQMLDILPQELFENCDTTFLDILFTRLIQLHDAPVAKVKKGSLLFAN